MAEQVTRTVFGGALQDAMLLGIPHEVVPFSTLNERFKVQQDVVHDPSQYPRMAFLAIGNGGHKNVSGADGIDYTKLLQHSPGDASVFKPLPFVLRPVASDLTAQERAKYAMRAVITANGEQYFAYYLKRLNLAQVTIAMQLRTTQDGVTTSVDFVPTADNLLPTPVELDNSGANALLGKSLVVSALLNVSLTAADCEELLNVARILYGTDNYAIISEMALAAGVNKVIGLQDNSNFQESISTQIVTHVGTFHQVRYANDGIAGLFDCGTNEPMLAPSA